jgi:hypothetical protein
MIERYRDGIGLERCAECLRLSGDCECAVYAGQVYAARKGTMRLFDVDHVGCYLDTIGHRVEKDSDGLERRMVDLTLRVQPFTVELAQALHGDVRALLFTLNDAAPKRIVKAAAFALTVPNQTITVRPVPELDDGALVLMDVEITGIRARTEKGVDGYACVFDASVGPVSARELEAFTAWHTEQRFLTTHPQQPLLDFAGAPEPEPAGPRPIRNRRQAREASA